MRIVIIWYNSTRISSSFSTWSADHCDHCEMTTRARSISWEDCNIVTLSHLARVVIKKYKCSIQKFLMTSCPVKPPSQTWAKEIINLPIMGQNLPFAGLLPYLLYRSQARCVVLWLLFTNHQNHSWSKLIVLAWEWWRMIGVNNERNNYY